MDSPAGGPPQRRAFPRIPLRVKVRMEFPEQRFFLSEWGVNLSPGGMFVRSESIIAPGQRFDFEASLTTKGPVFGGKAQVLWVRRQWDGSTRPPGFAVRFLEIEERGKEAITRLAEVFLADGVTAMQQELARLRDEWHARALEEESTGEIEVPPQETMPPTATFGVTSVAPAPPEVAAVPALAVDGNGGAVVADVAATVAAEGDGAPAIDGGAAIQPGAGEAIDGAANDAEPTLADATRRGSGRRRPWWVGGIVLLALGTAFLAWRRSERPPMPLRVAVPVHGANIASVPAIGARAVAPSIAVPARLVLAKAAAPRVVRPAIALEGVTWTSGDDGLWLDLTLDGAIPAEAIRRFRLAEDPPREVLQLAGAHLGAVAAVVPVHAPELDQVRVGFHPGDATDELRVVLDLPSPAVHVREVRSEGAVLRVRLSSDAPAGAAAAAAPTPGSATEPQVGTPAPGLSIHYDRR